MKKLFTLAAFGLCIVAAQAQPTLTSSLNPVPNDMIKYQPVDTAGVSEGSSGASQTWNFSTLTNTGSVVTSTYVAASSTPYASTYPTATIANVSASLQGDSGFTYYSTNSSGMNLLGVSTAQYDLIYNNPLEQLRWPITHNTTWSDNFTAHMLVNGVDVYRSGTFDLTADGYGTITTPAGTYSNVLRMKADQVNNDTFLFGGFPAGTQKTVVTTYNWMNATLNQPLMTISYITITGSSGTQSSKAVMYYPVGPVGISEAAGREQALVAFPNPATDRCAVNFTATRTGIVEARFFDLSGREVAAPFKAYVIAGTNEVILNTSSLSTGLYMVKLSDGETFASARVQISK